MIAWSLADLFIAGSETTATSLRWFLLYMMHNLDVQRKVQEEIDRVVGRDRLPLWEDREK
jgi:cytochrome P450